MAYLGILRGRPLFEPDDGTSYLSLDAATFVLGRKGRERRPNEGRMPTRGGWAKRGGGGEEMRGEVRQSGWGGWGGWGGRGRKGGGGGVGGAEGPPMG